MYLCPMQKPSSSKALMLLYLHVYSDFKTAAMGSNPVFWTAVPDVRNHNISKKTSHKFTSFLTALTVEDRQWAL